MPGAFHPQALAGQHIVISGGIGALGTGIVKGLVDHGARVTVNDIVLSSDALVRMDNAGIDREAIHYVQADMTQEEEVADVIAQAREAFGLIHTALCHVGMVIDAPLLEFSVSAWDRSMDVNVKSAFLLAKAAANAMLEDEVAGHLIFTLSWVASVPWPSIGPYNASKAAMRQLMRSFARELAPQGIRANGIAPGIVEVGMAKRQWESDPSYRARASKAIPLGYMQPLESVIDGFLFLCSDASSYMTGSVLLIDGGASLYPMD